MSEVVTGWDASDKIVLGARDIALSTALKMSCANNRVSEIIANAAEIEHYLRTGEAKAPVQPPVDSDHP